MAVRKFDPRWRRAQRRRSRAGELFTWSRIISVIRLLARRDGWTGTTAELARAVEGRFKEMTVSPHAVGRYLQSLAPFLEDDGVELSFPKTGTIQIRKVNRRSSAA
jgi:hypothetical protein